MWMVLALAAASAPSASRVERIALGSGSIEVPYTDDAGVVDRVAVSPFADAGLQYLRFTRLDGGAPVGTSNGGIPCGEGNVDQRDCFVDNATLFLSIRAGGGNDDVRRLGAAGPGRREGRARPARRSA